MSNIITFDGAGSTGSLIATPVNSNGIFHFVLTVLYGNPVVTTASTPTTGFPSFLNVAKPEVKLYSESRGLMANLELIGKKDYYVGNNCLGAIYTFTTSIIGSTTGDYFAEWHVPSLFVSYGSDVMRVGPLAGSSNTINAASLPSSRIALAGVVNPQNGNNSTLSSSYVDMRAFNEAMFIFLLGAVDTSIDIRIRETTNTSDGGGQTLKTATGLGGTNDNKQVIVNVKASELTSGYRYVRGRITADNGTTNMMAVVGIGLSPVSGPASDSNLATVLEVVA